MAANKLCHVTEGFREDCAKLIARFENLENVRFKDFCQIWKDMKFSLVFAGRKSLIEQIEFCEDTLIVAMEFFLPPLSFKERIGGLYLLYALYFKMPVEGPKIRAKIEDWRDILEIRAEIAQAEHHDASYILSKLLSDNAFVHCPLDRELGLEKSYRLKVPRLRNTYSVLAEIRKLAGPGDLFDRIDVLSQYYNQIKALEGDRSPGNDRTREDCSSLSLNLYESQFGQKLSDQVLLLEKTRKFANLGNSLPITSRDRMKFEILQKSNGVPAKKARIASDPIRCRLGHGFDTDSSGSENEHTSNSRREK